MTKKIAVLTGAGTQEVRQADPVLVSGGGPVSTTADGQQNQTLHTGGAFCGQHAAYAERDRVHQVPAPPGLRPDYALNWITPEWNTAHAFFSTCMGRPLLAIEIKDGETGKTVSRTTHALTLRDLRERGMVEKFTTAAERRRIERSADNGK